MRRSRVLMVAPTPFFADRGCHVQIAEEVWALQRLGFDVKVATYGLGRDVANVHTIRSFKFPFYQKFEAGPTLHKFYADPALFITSLSEAIKFKPHVIHGHLHEGCVIGWMIKKILGTPLLFDLQGSLTGELMAYDFALTKTKLMKKIWYHFEEWIDHRADMIVTQSTNMREELINYFHVPENKIVMTYDGVNTNEFVPRPFDDSLREQLGIPANRRIIVYLGTLTSHQGIDDLLAAFPQVLKAVPESYLLLMGYPNEDFYRQKVKELGLENAVKITGKIPYEEASRYLCLGEIAISPKRSATEANGKIYNYMACGLPTVAFDSVVNRDILGDLGVYAENIGDIEGLANTMIGLLRDPEKIKNLAKSVRQKAVDCYSWDGVARRLSDAYNMATRNKRH